MAYPRRSTVREFVERAVETRAAQLKSIYRFVLSFRPGTAEETIRARVYEAVEAGTIRRVAPGIYVAALGPATLVLIEGDAREVIAKWDSDSIDAIITDPPYDLGTRQHAMTGTTRPHHGRGRTYEQWDLDRTLLADMFRVLRKDKVWNTLTASRRQDSLFPRGGGAMLLFAPPLTRSTWREIFKLIQLAEQVGFVFYGSITWDQEVPGMGYDVGRNQRSDILFFTAGPRNGLLWNLGFANVIQQRRVRRRAGEHESEKPAGLFLNLAKAVTRAGDVVADFFVGRGTWIPAMLHEHRHIIVVDRSRDWVDRIKQDFQQQRLGSMAI